ncbi:MAG: hypothetical protein V1720_02745 [bacterium]
MLYKSVLSLFIIFSLASITFAQEEEISSFEINLIDSYVTPNEPYKFILSFFTDDSCTSKISIDNKHEFIVSTVLTDQHIAEIEIGKMKFDSSIVPFQIFVVGRNNEVTASDFYELILPFHEETFAENSSGIFTICCMGGIIFGVPSPGLVMADGKNYLSLSKEIPLLSYYGIGYNYPTGYIGIEYSYILKAPTRNYLRLGYKHLFQPTVIEYISPGINLFTDFLGFNGISPELSIGLFKLQNIFTVYTRYRFNFQPGATDRNFHEISIGLYSNFFSINL